VGLVEHVAGEVFEEVPDAGGFLGGAAGLEGALAELVAEEVDAIAVTIFDEGAAEEVCAAPGHVGEAVGYQ